MTQEQLRMQMLAGIITEGQYKEMLNENKLEIIGSDVDELLDAISILNRDMMNSKRSSKDKLKPLNTTGHEISDGKFSIEVEKIGDTEDNEYLRLANDYLEERGYQSKLYKAN
jgi:hypothetical protein